MTDKPKASRELKPPLRLIGVTIFLLLFLGLLVLFIMIASAISGGIGFWNGLLLTVAAGGLIWSGFLIRTLRRPRALMTEACLRCGYDLTNLCLPRCPECGALTGFRRSASELGIGDNELTFDKPEVTELDAANHDLDDQ